MKSLDDVFPSRLFAFICGCMILAAGVRARAEADGVRHVSLPNGVRLLLKPEADTEVVAMVAFVRREADTSALDNATGELVAHALFYGSLNRSMDRVARSVAQVGGALETLRTPDYVAITCVTVSAQLGEAIYLLCEALKNADFAPEALEHARQDIQEERRKRAEDAFEAAYAAVRERLGASPEPDDSALRRVTQTRAQDYFARHYLPARTVIAVVGRFRQEAARHAFDNALFDYDRRAVNGTGAPAEASKKPDAAPPTLVMQTEGNAAYALIGTPSPGVASPDYPAFTVLHALLGGGHAARLFRRIRETQGLGYDVGATYAADRSDPLVAYLQWDARRTLPAPNANAAAQPADALQRLQAQLDALLTDPPTEAELTRARNYAIGRDALRHERARDRAFFLGWYETMGLGYAFDAELPRRLAAVTRDDILRAAKTYLAPRAAVLALPKQTERAGEERAEAGSRR